MAYQSKFMKEKEKENAQKQPPDAAASGGTGSAGGSEKSSAAGTQFKSKFFRAGGHVDPSAVAPAPSNWAVPDGITPASGTTANGGLGRTEYHNNQQRAGDRARNRELAAGQDQLYAHLQAEENAYAEQAETAASWSVEEIDRKIRETDDRLQLLAASGQYEEADALKAELNKLYQLRTVSEYGQDEERNLYDYLLAEDGKTGGTEAQGYLDSLQETMNYRKGMEQVSNIRDIDNDILRTIAIGAHSVGTGMANAGTGYNQLLSDEPVPATAMQYASQELMDDMGIVGRTL